MTISELINARRGLFTDDIILKGDLIALDAKDGKILFDTRRNKREHINSFANGEISSLWADVKPIRGVYGNYFKPVIKCFVCHDSWKRGEEEA